MLYIQIQLHRSKQTNLCLKWQKAMFQCLCINLYKSSKVKDWLRLSLSNKQSSFASRRQIRMWQYKVICQIIGQLTLKMWHMVICTIQILCSSKNPK